MSKYIIFTGAQKCVRSKTISHVHLFSQNIFEQCGHIFKVNIFLNSVHFLLAEEQLVKAFEEVVDGHAGVHRGADHRPETCHKHITVA